MIRIVCCSSSAIIKALPLRIVSQHNIYGKSEFPMKILTDQSRQKYIPVGVQWNKLCVDGKQIDLDCYDYADFVSMGKLFYPKQQS